MGGKPRSQLPASKASAARAPVAEILAILHRTWGEATCELDHQDAYQLLVATILSAQCTDRRVNEVTPALFERYPDAHALAQAKQEELETLIRSTGFYRMKAKRLIDMAQMLVRDHDGEVPQTMKALCRLPGVDRKTANMVLGVAFGIASGVVVDTHVHRVSRRLGLTQEDKPQAIERELMELVPKDRWIDISQELIWHGRRICHARKPECERCPVAALCPSAQTEPGSPGSPGSHADDDVAETA